MEGSGDQSRASTPLDHWDEPDFVEEVTAYPENPRRGQGSPKCIQIFDVCQTSLQSGLATGMVLDYCFILCSGIASHLFSQIPKAFTLLYVPRLVELPWLLPCHRLNSAKPPSLDEASVPSSPGGGG